jgi:peptide/nickel transport system ATP-binding protein
MYAGEIVETAASERLRNNPQHPYTRGLMESFPPLTGPMRRLVGIAGSPPDLSDPPAGCRFNPRCPLCVPEHHANFVRQTTVQPRLRELEPDHFVACHLAGDSA